MDESVMLRWLKDVFLADTKHLRSAATPVVLWVDGFAAHVTLAVRELAAANHVLLARFAPHTTHLTQPLDVGCLKGVKAARNTALDMVRIGEPYRVLDVGDIITLLVTKFGPPGEQFSAAERGFSSQNVKAAFEKTGLFPQVATRLAGKVTARNEAVSVAPPGDEVAEAAELLLRLPLRPSLPEGTPVEPPPGAVLLTSAQQLWVCRQEALEKAEKAAEKAERATERVVKRVAREVEAVATKERVAARKAAAVVKAAEAAAAKAARAQEKADRAAAAAAAAAQRDAAKAAKAAAAVAPKSARAPAPGPRGGSGAKVAGNRAKRGLGLEVPAPPAKRGRIVKV
jgi:hypothetical protein